MDTELITFSTLAGVPVLYDRDDMAPYGSRGRAYPFAAQRTFVRQMDACYHELWEVAGRGAPDCLTSAGAFTRKPGRHGVGRAFDLDGIFWPDRAFITLEDGFAGRDRPFYFGVECVLRRHFGQVLNYDYNPAHRDHFHIDDAQPVGLRTDSRALVLFLQGMLRSVFGERVTASGDWSYETQEALARTYRALGLRRVTTAVDGWRDFLSVSAQLALRPRSGRYPGEAPMRPAVQ